MQAYSIADVINHLDTIIDHCRKRKSRMGYFAALYKKMTLAVWDGIKQGVFANGKRMERLDVIFANRYLEAWYAYTNNKPCTNAWCTAFDAANNNHLIVLQHLILGINTHINLDLGIAAADTAPGNAIYDLQSDFEKINDIIASLAVQVQETLSNIWFPLRFISKITNRREQAVLNFSIKKAREAAWANALALANTSGQARTNYVHLIDSGVVAIARRIINPGMYAKMLLQPVLIMEDKDVTNVIDILNERHLITTNTKVILNSSAESLL